MATMDDIGPCYEVEGGTVRNGYPRVNVGGHDGYYVSAHRVAWMAVNGPIPEGGLILHHCDNRPCIRATHLYLGDHADNSRDRVMRMRSWRKLADHEVAEIRSLYSRYGSRLGGTGLSGKELAGRYGVGRSQISRIVNGTRRRGAG